PHKNPELSPWGHTLPARSPFPAVSAPSARRFHMWMAGVFLLIAFGGFIPTYWMKLAQGAIHVPPIVHVHGFLLFTWTLFYFCQTAFVASGRVATHRAWGLAGISLFTLLACSII